MLNLQKSYMFTPFDLQNIKLFIYKYDNQLKKYNTQILGATDTYEIKLLDYTGI